MRYFADRNYIISLIEKYTRSPVLWLDTEVADFTSRNPKLSLIQIIDTKEQPETNVVILDVLYQPEVVDTFVEQIMLNPVIEKVFHNAKYDLKFLGKTKAKNVTCTLEMAKKVPYYLLPLPNLSLKTLAESLCNIAKVDKTQQASDWGQRPLNENQLIYAQLDPVCLCMVHQKLLHLQAAIDPNPVDENITQLTKRYLKLKHQQQIIESEVSHLEARIKATMQAQNLTETDDIKISPVSRTTLKVAFNQLAEIIQANDIQLDLPITLTQKLQKDLGKIVEQLTLQEEVTNSWRLTVKQEEVEEL